MYIYIATKTYDLQVRLFFVFGHYYVSFFFLLLLLLLLLRRAFFFRGHWLRSHQNVRSGGVSFFWGTSECVFFLLDIVVVASFILFFSGDMVFGATKLYDLEVSLLLSVLVAVVVVRVVVVVVVIFVVLVFVFVFVLVYVFSVFPFTSLFWMFFFLFLFLF